MYERSAIVLEKYFNKIFGFNEKNNLKNLYNSYKNIIEENRNKLFDDLDEDPALLEKKLEKIGQTILSNNERLEELKNGFTENLNEFNERQKERNLELFI